MYKFTIAILQKVSQNSPTPLMIERQPKISLWHERLGHISIQGVHELSKEGHSTVLPYILIINIVCDKVCWESNTRKSCQQRAQWGQSCKISCFTLIFVDLSNIGHWEGHNISSHFPRAILKKHGFTFYLSNLYRFKFC